MGKRDWFVLGMAVFFFAALLAGCFGAPSPVPNDPSALHTQAVQTVSAKLTLDAGSTAVVLLTQMAQPTVTPSPSPSETTTATPIPATPTQAPLTPTLQPPAPTTSSAPCDWLEFVSDVTVQDGKEFLPGAQFTKTWRLKNIGSCTWTREYDLVYIGGDQLSSVVNIPLGGNIPPGTMVDVSINMTAPEVAGTYTSYWQLRNASDVLFGGGEDRDRSFYVRIKVDEEETVFYDMAVRYCRAEWANSRLGLQCPTPIEDQMLGFVYKDDNPRLETGDREEEPALVTHPDRGGIMRFDFLGEQGLIAGAFPEQLIEEGDRFEAVIGCMYGHRDCNVQFYLLLQKPNGNYDILASWQEYYDGEVTTVIYDLSEWAGREIGLILAVVANGSADDDYAFWLSPRLVR